MLVIPLAPPKAGLPETSASAVASSSSSTASDTNAARASGRPRRTFSRATTVSSVSTPTPPPSSSSRKASSSARVQDYPVPLDTPLPPSSRASSDVTRDIARVWEAVAGARRAVVICGAGISVSAPANIPDFRSATGLFRTLKEKHPTAGLSSGKDLFDARLFGSESSSALFYSMISELKQLSDAAAPTNFHHLLKRLDAEGRLMRVYTQNIDNLEERAGLTFGLGEAGDSTATVRALGKRRRNEKAKAAQAAAGQQAQAPPQPRGVWGRAQSDSALLRSHQERFAADTTPEADCAQPMFPRTIPLHGSLSALTCSVCSYRLVLSPTDSPSSNNNNSVRSASPERDLQRTEALALLAAGEPVPCHKCTDYEAVRAVAGLRSRGVGRMKVGVVLYGGQNDGAEQIGECVQRDILGLRDPNETPVPESNAERAARERKSKKEEEQRNKTCDTVKSTSPATLMPIVEVQVDDALKAAFDDDEEEDVNEQLTVLPPASSLPVDLPHAPPRKRAARLKPLPPDLLIVAGTSLKVPGTKRIVREFAKACRARDRRVWSDESGHDTDRSPSPDASRRSSRRTAGKARRSPSISEASDAEEEEEEEEDDFNAPIRTILLNYDFPAPPREWEDVFDVWVQGDVQQAALGLWEASTYPAAAVAEANSMSPGSAPAPLKPFSWAPFMPYLEAERVREKKEARLAKRTSPNGRSTNSVSPAVSLEAEACDESDDEALPKTKVRRTKAAQSPAAAAEVVLSATKKPTVRGKKAVTAKSGSKLKPSSVVEVKPKQTGGKAAKGVVRTQHATARGAPRTFARSTSTDTAASAKKSAAGRKQVSGGARRASFGTPGGIASVFVGTKASSGGGGKKDKKKA